MGTVITLEVAGLALTWNKNHVGWDHGSLFQECDRQRRHSDQINYDYYREHQEDPAEMEMAFARPLEEVVPRIELLGFTLDFIRREYDRAAVAWSDEHQLLSEGDDLPAPDLMSFDEFCAFATEHAIEALDSTFVASSTPEAYSLREGRFRGDERLQGIPYFSALGSDFYSERSYFGYLIRFLHPYSLLRVLALNTANLKSEVVWQYGPLLDAGWAEADEFVPGARRTETFLVATEGSSDVHILQRALSLLKPGVSDFFRFIDVTESHPFSGAGNLLRFAEGLVKIDVHNQVVFLFDNDAEGHSAHKRISRMKLPTNMRAMMLPELDEFRSFAARGPEGITTTDINRRAAAIECYLDLNFEMASPPQVLWTNYKPDLDVYQGALEFKESYAKKFLQQTAAPLQSGSYDVTKIRAVLDALVAECSSLRMEIVNSDYSFEVERD